MEKKCKNCGGNIPEIPTANMFDLEYCDKVECQEIPFKKAFPDGFFMQQAQKPFISPQQDNPVLTFPPQ